MILQCMDSKPMARVSEVVPTIISVPREKDKFGSHYLDEIKFSFCYSKRNFA